MSTCFFYFKEVLKWQENTYLNLRRPGKLEKMLKEDIPVVKIAEEIGMTRHAIYAELRRNGKSDNKKLYSADEAQKQLLRN